MEILIEETKTCTKCKEEKPLSEFYFQLNSKLRAGGSYRPDCKKCKLEADRIRRMGK